MGNKMRNIIINIIILIFLGLLLAACTTISNTPKTNPEAAIDNTKLGLLYLQQHKIEPAKAKLLLAMQQDPNSPIVLDSMAYFIEQTGDSSKAKAFYLKAIDLKPENSELKNNYGAYLCRQKQYKKAIKYFLLAARDINYLYTAKAYENAGLCALRIPNKKLAQKYLKKSLENDPNNQYVKKKLLKLV